MTLRQTLWLAARVLALLLLVYVALRLSGEAGAIIALDPTPETEKLLRRLVLVGLSAYALLTAIPFVPGAEIGMALLAVFGASIAPAVYIATILALCLAFFVGRVVHPARTARVLRACRMEGAATFLEEIATLPHKQIIAHLVGKTNPGLVRFLISYRYLAVILLINLPGSTLIGGGGGIALAAGLARIFHPLGFVVSIAIGVLPVPLAFFLWPLP